VRLSGDDPLDVRPRLVLQTRWRIVSVPHLPNTLDVLVVVDTTARPIITAIEDAATRAGIVLERVSALETRDDEHE
jgi:hypothetical protein